MPDENATDLSNLLGNMLIRIVAMEKMLKSSVNINPTTLTDAQHKVAADMGWPPKPPLDTYREILKMLKAFLEKQTHDGQ